MWALAERARPEDPSRRRYQAAGNRFQLEVDDLASTVDRLRASGAQFRGDVVQGQGGDQILVEDRLATRSSSSSQHKAEPVRRDSTVRWSADEGLLGGIDIGELGPIELGVATVGGQQSQMISPLGHPAVLDEQDLVGGADGR